ncbi:hypothetical protein POM88_044525 [Heracleum sosnowskyi]|uniref:Uncharacterized protein n=1 Tax=Heracleum sosnowskyi TaxID=360622 RepID=A0AAD8H476_9APIA|nr:hypothetical protein POM88_044525 [Heracleum sosnowskyi]
MKQGSWQYFYKYELERINALLNFEEKDERTWKIDIARYLKLHADYEENMRKENEKKNIQKEKEMAEMEERAKELRQKGMCRVKQNPYIVEYKNSHGGQSKIRMEFLDSYVESALKAAIDDLEGSPLIEELIAREELQEAIIDMKRKEEIRKKKIYDDLLEKQLEAEAAEQQKLVIRHEIVPKDLTHNLGEIVRLKTCLNTTINKPTLCDYVTLHDLVISITGIEYRPLNNYPGRSSEVFMQQDRVE